MIGGLENAEGRKDSSPVLMLNLYDATTVNSANKDSDYPHSQVHHLETY